MARPKLYESNAARQAAHRARNSVVDVRLPAETLETIGQIAAQFQESRTEVINSMIQFALLNRNWKQLGLFGKRLPNAQKKGE